jgi:hypothetical protein
MKSRSGGHALLAVTLAAGLGMIHTLAEAASAMQAEVGQAETMSTAAAVLGRSATPFGEGEATPVRYLSQQTAGHGFETCACVG